jgi:Transglycosylase SLT domain
MNIAQLSEQLKDVPQGTLVGYAKNPNSVVPQFLALAEIQRRQHLQAQAPAPTGTVADDVLAQANPVPQQPQQMAPQQVDPRVLQAQAMQQQAQQLPENQPGVAQLPTGMPQGMASGGIVAFAGGGMPDMGGDDEDYQDYLDNAEQGRISSGIDEALASLKGRVAGVARSVPQSVKETVSGIRAALPESYETAKTKTTHNYESAKSTHPYASVALDEAKKLGLNPNEILHMLHKETGNLKDPGAAVSKAGARGPMQLMPGTAKELGVDINDPEANTRGGVRYYAKMLDMFKGDPVMAMAAYNAGPGRVRQMMQRGHGIESLPQETQGYVKRSEGGITKLATGNLISADDYNNTVNYDDQRNVEPSYAFAPQKMSLSDYYAGQDTTDAEGYAPMSLRPEKVEPLNAFDEFIRQQREDQAELKSGRKQDAYLALMQAGFGMMGGTSPYAMANIGQGAASGVNAYANFAKQRGSELAASKKAEGSAIANKILNDIRQSGIDERATAAKSEVEEKAYKRQDLSRSTAIREANDARETAIARFNSDPEVKKLAALQAESQDSFKKPYYDKLLEIRRNNAFAEAGVPGYKMITEMPVMPTESVKAPSDFWQMLPGTHKLTDEDKKALEWANSNPLDPRANAIKERFK